MTTAASLVRKARQDAGLSCRGLARRAGVPASTVTRIEAGEMDPTVTMLQRVLAGASRLLLIETSPRPTSPSTASIADAALLRDGGRRVPWTELRGFADWGRRHPQQIAAAVADPPPRTSQPFDAILASFVDELCERHGIDRPRWSESVPPLATRWEPPGTPAMLARARRETSRAFRDRNITLRATDLFRERVPQ